jgi:hypothetical protein
MRKRREREYFVDGVSLKTSHFALLIRVSSIELVCSRSVLCSLVLTMATLSDETLRKVNSNGK